MLVFLDESGDTGRRVNSGSSKFFLIGLAVFDDDSEALLCDQRISLLRKELNRSNDFEFHFSDNSDNVRKAFISAVQPYNFYYVIVAINKDPRKLTGDGFNSKSSFYKYACFMVMNKVWPRLSRAHLIIDKSGNSTFQGELRRYIRNKMDDQSHDKIKKFKMQDSASNNLLQLADYCVGVCNRKVQKKKNWQLYYNMISAKEMDFQIWPK